MSHEQSETIQRPDGRWINVYGRNTPKAGQQLPGTPDYPTVDAAVTEAGARSAAAGRRFEITAPGGKRYEITAPEGATQEQVLAYAQQQFGAAQKPSIPKPAFEQEAERLVGTTGPELIAGSAPGRFALGAASPFIGAAQLAANAVGLGAPVNAHIQQLEQMKQRGMEAQPSPYPQNIPALDTADIAGAAGTMASPATIGAMKLAPAATIAGRIGQGTAIGTGFGATAPVTGGDSFWADKGIQTGIGAGLGAAIPSGIEAVKGAYRVGRNIIDPMLSGGIDRLLGRTLNTSAGDKRQAIVQALRQNEQIVPGSMPTAGEAAAPVGRAEFSGLEGVVRGRAPSEFDAIRQAQNEARVHALRGITSSTGFDNPVLPPMQAAERVRDANARVGYGAVRNDLINPTPPEQVLAERIAAKEASKASALQDMGRFQTMASQQETLAHGGGINLRGDLPGTNLHPPIPGQTFNAPYMNVGAGGGRALSPSAYPAPGYPRIAGRYTENIQRVPEARGAASDAAAIAQQRQLERDFLQYQLNALLKTVGNESPQLTSLLSRPSMRDALMEAMQSAAETGGYFPKATVLGHGRGIEVEAGQPFSVANLQRMKQALDDVVKDPTTFGLKGTQIQEIQGTRDAFVRWLSNRSPGWAAARNKYAQDSLPINQMQVGQYLDSKLVPALNDAGASGNQRAQLYAQALRDAPGTLKRATGQPRYDELGQVLDEGQLAAATNVGRDLARTGENERLARLGREKAADIIGTEIPKVPAAGMFNPKYSVVRAIMNRVSGKLTERSTDRLAEVLRDPQLTAQLMEAATPSERAVLVEALLADRVSRLATILGAQGGATVPQQSPERRRVSEALRLGVQR